MAFIKLRIPSVICSWNCCRHTDFFSPSQVQDFSVSRQQKKSSVSFRVKSLMCIAIDAELDLKLSSASSQPPIELLSVCRWEKLPRIIYRAIQWFTAPAKRFISSSPFKIHWKLELVTKAKQVSRTHFALQSVSGADLHSTFHGACDIIHAESQFCRVSCCT